MPERGNNELNNDHKRPDSSETSYKLVQEANATPFWETLGFKQGSSEFAGSFVAGVTGVITFSAATAIKRNAILKATSVCVAPALGGFWKHATKEGMDSALNLHGKEKSASQSDYWTGALDAFAGIAGSAAEKKVSHWYTGYVGRRELTRGSASHAGGLKHEFTSWLSGKAPTGLVSDKSAIAEGERILSQDVLPQIAHNVLRGTAGGYTGSLVWSVPHRIVENADAIKTNPSAGTIKTISEVGVDTTLGTLLGAGTAGLITTALNGRNIARSLRAHAAGDEVLTRLDIAYFNDAHSQTLGDRNFARASTKIKEIRQGSASLDNSNHEGVVSWNDIPNSKKFSHWWKQFIGAESTMNNDRSYRNSLFIENGDLGNANVTAPWTGWGKKEDKIIRAMGVDSQTEGNHWPDHPGGSVDVDTMPKHIHEQNIATNKKRPIVIANQDYSELKAETAHYMEEIVRPYIVHELKGPKGQPVKAATIGLVTEEGAVGGIKYQDPFTRLEQTIAQIKKEHPDLNIFIVQSHLGDELDRQLAAQNKDISVIFGAHSHKAFGTPVWINNGERDVAIMQAGAYLSHVGEANLAFHADGSLNRFHSTSKLHAITKDIKEDPIIDAIIKEDLPKELEELRLHSYNATATSKYNLDNARRGENTTANLIIDAMVADNQKMLPPIQRPHIVSAQSGFIRTGIPGNQDITRLDLCKTVINAGKPADEMQEQVMLNITGKQFKDVLEFGVSDLNPPQEPGLRGFIKQMFNRLVTGKSMPSTDDPQGNLLHINGSYTIDLTKPAGQRVSNIKLNENGVLTDLSTNRNYLWQNRWHFIDKAHKAGALFGDRSLEEMYKATNATAYTRSIVDSLGEHIRGKTLDPKVHGKIEGRIIDATPQPFSLQYGPGPSIPTFSLLSARDTMSDDQKAH